MKKNIAVIMGGYSSEVAISIKSGTVVHQHIDLEKYIPYQVHILKDRWVVLDNNDTKLALDSFCLFSVITSIALIFCPS